MEPQADLDQLPVWLDCVCGYAGTSAASHARALERGREWLAAHAARPTLMCMEKVAEPAPTALAARPLARGGGVEVSVGEAQGGGGGDGRPCQGGFRPIRRERCRTPT